MGDMGVLLRQGLPIHSNLGDECHVHRLLGAAGRG
jgi:hypothetical protein